MKQLLYFSVLLSVCIPAIAGEPSTPATNPLAGIDVQQRLGESIPLDLPFRDETGAERPLRDWMHGRPVILTPVYFGCPMLCTTSLNQLARSLQAMNDSAGAQFDILTVSFDPRETPTLARAKQASYLRSYRRPTAAAGWHFLTGDQTSIEPLMNAIGFHYGWNPQQQAFIHTSAVIVLTPEGKISRYFLGVDYPPTELQAAVTAANRSQVGPPAEAVYFYCLRYDPATGRYSVIIARALRMLAVLTFATIVGLIVILSRRNAGQRRAVLQ